MLSKTKPFSHIYVEEGVAGEPRCERILARFRNSEVVVVDDYQNVFGRGRQDFWRQKAAPKLILARKKDQFLYAGNDFLQAGVSPNFAYNALVMNCPYDCHYCYLQGMYGSANLVAFVNLEDYFAAAEAFHARRPDPEAPAILAISYDTDLLALEGILGYVSEWVEWSRGRNQWIIEVRTKSTGGRLLGEVPPDPCMRIAWTLSPERVAQRYESGAPALGQRLAGMRRAAEKGWRLTLSVDPILRVPGWREVYTHFASQLREAVPWEAVDRVELGVFRVGTQHFKRMRKRPGTDLLHYPYEHASNTVSLNEEVREEMVGLLHNHLTETISPNIIHIWT
jgi:spore photoproduct lyase